MAGGRGPGSIGTSASEQSVDTGTLARVSAPAPGTLAGGGREEFDREIDLLQAELANVGATAALDGAARARYDALIREFRDDLYTRVKQGRLTWREAATEAHGLRDTVRQIVRRQSTPVGRALAERLKSQGPTLNEMVARKTIELFGRGAEFSRLTPAQQNEVYAAIVKSSGKSNPIVTARMRTVSRAGRGLLFVSVAISVYTVATADDPVAAAKHEGAVTAAGIGGGVAGGMIAGLWCGPGAPVCVAIGAFVGGAAAALGVDLLW